MPRVNWGVSARDIDNFDRDTQYKPYDGPTPTNGVYQFKLKVLKAIAGTRAKNPQLRIGLELVPRKGRTDERQYAGYFLMAFAPISDKTGFRYIPFLDAIGVSGKDFEERTIVDTEGNIKKIGRWGNTGNEMIMAEIKDGQDKDGNSRKDIGWMGPLTDDVAAEDPEDDEEYDDELPEDEVYDLPEDDDF